jgi:hypothetical protein
MNKPVNMIIVCCPGNLVTGGTELLHQLVHELRNIKKNAYITYYPFNRNFDIPEQFRCYNVDKKDYIDSKCVTIVIPETITKIIKHIRNSKIYIWWLSVDYYFGHRGDHKIKDIYYYVKTLIDGRIPLYFLKKHTHLVQSTYAKIFLMNHGISPLLLSDYLATEHLSNSIQLTNRNDSILYNPKKGIRVTNYLIKKLPEFKFIAIQNMSKIDVAKLFSMAKIYIDFGNHPGKDRMPREAAMAGCCIVTGTRGSAANEEDINIDLKYKLDDSSKIDYLKFSEIIIDITNNYPTHFLNFAAYRKQILDEKSIFSTQVKNIFQNLS